MVREPSGIASDCFDELDLRLGLRNGAALGPKAFHMQGDRLAHQLSHFLRRLARSHAPRQIWAIPRVGVALSLDDDKVCAHPRVPFKPACLIIEASVPLICGVMDSGG